MNVRIIKKPIYLIMGMIRFLRLMKPFPGSIRKSITYWGDLDDIIRD